MAKADRKEFCKLAVDQNRDKGKNFEVFNLSLKMINFMIIKCPKFVNGEFDYGNFLTKVHGPKTSLVKESASTV